VSNARLLEEELERFGVDLSHKQKQDLAFYCDELGRWNRKINLTALTGVALIRRLVVEPVWIARCLPLDGSFMDIGSGNGSPAIPFIVAAKGIRRSYMIEARAKRAAFIRHVTTALGLKNLAVYRARFEDVAETLPKADWISLQAVALTAQIIETVRFVASGSRVFLFRLDLS
jgi:16S rRNA (guanine527-N7)-methyltransferase